MSQISRVTTWSTGQVLTASALNGEFNNIINAWNNQDSGSSSWGVLKVSGASTFSGVCQFPAGTVSTPAINLGDSGTGFYRSAANQLALAISGSIAFKCQASGMDVSGMSTLALPDGTVSAPGLSWSANAGSGFYRIGSNDIACTTNGTKAWEVSASQVFSLTNALLPASGGTGTTTKLIRTGTYTGNGGTQSVAHGLGATPDLVIISVSGTGNNVAELFITGMTNSHDFNGTNQTNAITGVDGTNITLGANAAVNSNAISYGFIAIKAQ